MKKKQPNFLSENEEIYKALFLNIPIETIVVDKNAQIIKHNCTKTWVGDKPPKINDFMFIDYIKIKNRDINEKLLNYLKKPALKEFFNIKYNNKFLHLKIAPFLDGAVITLTDVTNTEKINHERLRLEIAIEQIRESVAITNINGTIEYVNKAFKKNTGYKHDELIGNNLLLIEGEKHKTLFKTEIKKVLLNNQRWIGRHKCRKKDGSFYDVELTFSPIKNESGKICRYISVRRDITRENQLELMLIHAQKMKAIGTLAGGIAHDFNSILGSIVLNTELALEDICPDTETEYSLKQVLIASKKARDLVEQMLTFSKNSEVEQKIVKISTIVKDILKMLRSMISSTIEIKQSIDNDTGNVLANPVQIQQLVMNLCSNAAQAMKNGGTLYIKLETIKTDELSRLSGIKTDNLIKLTVKDTGDGISKKDVERIFDPFFTTKRIGDGTGLGLSVVHGIVVSHNGYITVESKQKKGSVFEVFLPKVENETSLK